MGSRGGGVPVSRLAIRAPVAGARPTPAPLVAGGVEQAGDVGIRADDRQVVGGPGSKPEVDPQDPDLGEEREQAGRTAGDPPGDRPRHRPVQAHELAAGSDQDRPAAGPLDHRGDRRVPAGRRGGGRVVLAGRAAGDRGDVVGVVDLVAHAGGQGLGDQQVAAAGLHREGRAGEGRDGRLQTPAAFTTARVAIDPAVVSTPNTAPSRPHRTAWSPTPASHAPPRSPRGPPMRGHPRSTPPRCPRPRR